MQARGVQLADYGWGIVPFLAWRGGCPEELKAERREKALPQKSLFSTMLLIDLSPGLDCSFNSGHQQAVSCRRFLAWMSEDMSKGQ